MGARVLFAVFRACFLLVLLTAAGRALAHPHVWITNVATFVFEGNKVVALRLQWTFDPFYGEMLARDFDKNRNKTFDPDEIKAIQANAFSSLVRYNYFTHLRVGGAKVAFKEVASFTASVGESGVRYQFTLALPQPLDPAEKPIGLSVYDESYYIEILLDEQDPVRFEGVANAACHFKVVEDKENPIYFGLVYPQQMVVACERS